MRGSTSRVPEPGRDDAARPDVLVDVVFDDGVLFLSLANFGTRPAVKVVCRFDRPFRGLGGTVDVSRLRLFRSLEFLAPGREIRTLLDTSAAYFARREPTKLAATLTWRDEDGRRYERRITHDLAVYAELTYVVPTGLTAPK